MDSLAIPFPAGRTIAEFPGGYGGNGGEGSDPEASARKPLQLTVRSLMNRETRVEAFDSDTVLDLKLLLQDVLLVPVHQQLLVFRYQALTDSDTIGECGLTDGCELVLILRMRGGDPTPVVPDEAEPMELSIRIRRGKCVVVKTCLGATVGSVKRSIEKLTEMPVAQQILTFRGEDMDNEKTLAHYELRDRYCVYLYLNHCEHAPSPPTVEDRAPSEEGPADVLTGLLSRLYDLFF